jgi:diguanylate cyclase (GGDEF)-like protein
MKFGRPLVFLLIIFTLIVLIWHNQGFKIFYSITPDSKLPHYVFSDRTDMGRSKVKDLKKNNKLGFECDIKPKYKWPYCKIEFTLGSSGFKSGLDLSKYSSVFIKTNMKGNGSTRLRLTLANYHGSYSKVGENLSLKPNFFEFDPSLFPDGIEINLDDFQVISWWISQFNIPLEHMNSDFSNVTQLHLQTINAVEGNHKVDIELIEFRGTSIRKDQVYLFIILVWLGFGLLYILTGFSSLRSTLQHTYNQNKELESLNDSLKLQSNHLEAMAKRDPLTGALNRAGIRDPLFKALKAFRDDEIPLSVIFIDLDHFKSVNDTHGHDVGDAVLIELCKLTSNSIRQNEIFARWGGEEFLLICPEADLFICARIAEKLRSLIENHTWPEHLNLTASLGIASMNKRESSSSLINRADEALYKAKEQGRNRVVVSQD